ncbi:UDP-2-acetamido-2,6-beta-L-arabino-hexul-4-ose reductase [Vibrio parahaemolyticus]|uniref:UDP-2-acetamido-2,6-beta-L-arabino-hexul-4-ose reductase n=2 Tax=Vibrio parahaemolyticus TaxID=670 RepID=UPI0006A6A539|nr:capsular polysaccharide biosynthesis protein CapF [Vibrio parahaemolyticus]EGR0211443.1 capsular polysaccharide biosynthesis protein CapF [Vibrio parahaemolyticus]EJG0102350.1 capsular polysaccharide biosynthesis protein CapF [Vibrio parahaemolyticus]EJG0562315.1 capsular polysaccharide biosynthesis protein CapF [Vibrio parahaemolyticus]EJG0572372.1 capsular polysaccharide biosynthesis protein CapF [Vibrio parahaemolyticus]KON62297.1 capsular biosynthesis protein [Vibrio parahaemolyticus]
MKILVTGAKGFIGKNLCTMLREQGYSDIIEIDRETSRDELVESLKIADFVYHLAGVNRPKDDKEFLSGNSDLTSFIVQELKNLGKKVPIMVSSSIQVDRDNPYGSSKRLAEQAVEQYGEETGAPFFIYRFPNVFGKWCRPNYNSFVATFCHNTLNDLNITIHDPSAPVKLVYIDDVCAALIMLLEKKDISGFKQISPEYQTTVGDVAELLQSFKRSRDNLITENVGEGLVRALYSTYLSYMSPEQFSYTIPSYGDERGVFSEMLKTKQAGQFSFFTAHPGITRGGHYHHSKNEKFLVLKGKARFKFEHIGTGERYELETEGCAPQIVETVPGWSHDITNIGEEEMIVMLWANEIFDREAPDTFAFPL